MDKITQICERFTNFFYLIYYRQKKNKIYSKKIHKTISKCDLIYSDTIWLTQNCALIVNKVTLLS